jgi:hypothetical protein
MNFTENFEDFSNKLGTMDVLLYAGAAIILWVLFKDRISPIQSLILNLIEKVKKISFTKSIFSITKSSVLLPSKPDIENLANNNSDDLFFQLISSWKQTRDLALQCKCEKAVEVADEMFPFLSPNICNKETNHE